MSGVNDIAIRAENLSKLYRVGQFVGYKTLRESLMNVILAPFHRPHSNTPGVAPQDTTSKYIWALKGISFEVKQGEAIGIIGRNGAGKTTLLKILSRITKPTEGSAEIRGRVGSLLEVGTAFHPELTGRENVYLNGAVLGMKRKEIKRKFDEIIDFAGEVVENFIDTPLKRYSNGMQVRLAFSVAAHLEPEILLVDEVLAVGDVEFQKKCLSKMGDVTKGGRTVLFVSHNLPAIQRLCSQAYLLDEGKIITGGNTDSVLDAYYGLTEGSSEQEVADLQKVPPGAVRFLRWNLQSSKTNSPYSCFTQDRCIFEFLLVARRTLPAANFTFIIEDGYGRIILILRRTLRVSECIPLAEGIYKVQFSVESLPIQPSRYILRALITDVILGDVAEWYAQPRLTVLPKKGTDALEGSPGILNIDSKVEIKDVTEEVTATSSGNNQTNT